MSGTRARQKIYVFDSSSYIELGMISVQSLPVPDLIWTMIRERMVEGSIISQRYVYEECVTRKSKKPDVASKWLEDLQSHFLIENANQITIMGQIVHEFPKIIDPENEKEQADPYLVALASDLQAQNPDVEYVIVTQEGLLKTTNLCGAAKKWGIRPINLRQFFDEIGLTLEVSMKTEVKTQIA